MILLVRHLDAVVRSSGVLGLTDTLLMNRSPELAPGGRSTRSGQSTAREAFDSLHNAARLQAADSAENSNAIGTAFCAL